jgi:hypothetical protein
MNNFMNSTITTTKISNIAIAAFIFVVAGLSFGVAPIKAHAYDRYSSYSSYYPTSAPVYVAPTPIYPVIQPVAYNYYPTTYPTYYPTNNYSPVGGSCYAVQTTANVGQSITWQASAYGGNGTYSYSWSGTNGLYGYGSAISFSYNTSGTMVANLTIMSAGQSISVPCSNSVIVYGNSYSYPTTVGSNYNYNNYNYTYSNPLAATCSANTTSTNLGQGVTWTSNVTGGNGYYSYTWSGSNNLYGSGSAISTSYSVAGQQYAQVTVYSNGQSVTAQCTNSVNVGNYNYNYTNTYTNTTITNTNGALNVGCAADTASARVGTPVTWSVEALGGSGTYTYAWSGSDGLAGSQSSVVTSYGTSGQKSAVVIVTSSNGQTASKSCPAITVTSGVPVNYGSNNSGSSQNTNASQNNSNNSGLSAASLFSLSNIPWGWVAVLIILVLFGTIMYLLFNKNKI